MANIITPKCRLSYANIVVPVAGTDDEGNKTDPRYSVCLVFDPGTDLTPLKRAIAGVIVDRFGEEKARELLPRMVAGGSLKNPLREDVEKKYGDGQHFFMNARNTRKPGKVHPFVDPLTGQPKKMTDAEAKELMYSGAWARASVSFYWFDKKGNKGVGCSLQNVQWIDHGERLDNVIAAENEFDALTTAPAGMVPAGTVDLASLI